MLLNQYNPGVREFCLYSGLQKCPYPGWNMRTHFFLSLRT